MKIIFNTIFFSCFLVSFFSGFSQDKEAGIYSFQFQVEDSIFNDEDPFPSGFLDSIKKSTENTLSSLLGSKVKCVYKINKKGKWVTTVGMFGILDSMPTNTFKDTKKNYSDLSYFIEMRVAITPKGGQVLRSTEGNSTIQPMVRINVWVYDQNKKKILKKEVVRGDFGNMRLSIREEVNQSWLQWILGVKPEIENDVLQPIEVLYMYQKTLELIKNK